MARRLCQSRYTHKKKTMRITISLFIILLFSCQNKLDTTSKIDIIISNVCTNILVGKHKSEFKKDIQSINFLYEHSVQNTYDDINLVKVDLIEDESIYNWCRFYNDTCISFTINTLKSIPIKEIKNQISHLTSAFGNYELTKKNEIGFHVIAPANLDIYKWKYQNLNIEFVHYKDSNNFNFSIEDSMKVITAHNLLGETTLSFPPDPFQKPKIIKRDDITLPDSLFDIKDSVLVVIDFVVDSLGKPTELKVIKTSNERFNAAAIEHLKKIKFLPGKLKDKPINTKMIIPIRFNNN